MILVLQKNTPEPAIRQLLAQLALQNVKGGCVAGETSLLLPLVGETWRLDLAALQALPYVQEARRLTPAYHLAARSTHPENTVVPVGDVRVGADFCLIAGPCAVESAYQIQTVAAVHRQNEVSKRPHPERTLYPASRLISKKGAQRPPPFFFIIYSLFITKCSPLHAVLLCTGRGAFYFYSWVFFPVRSVFMRMRSRWDFSSFL